MSEIVAPGRQWVTAALEQIFLMMESLMMRSGAGDGESRTTVICNLKLMWARPGQAFIKKRLMAPFLLPTTSTWVHTRSCSDNTHCLIQPSF